MTDIYLNASSSSDSLKFKLSLYCKVTIRLYHPVSVSGLAPEIPDSHRRSTLDHSFTSGVKIQIFFDLRELQNLLEPSPNDEPLRSCFPSGQTVVELKLEYSGSSLLGRLSVLHGSTDVTLLPSINYVHQNSVLQRPLNNTIVILQLYL